MEENLSEVKEELGIEYNIAHDITSKKRTHDIQSDFVTTMEFKDFLLSESLLKGLKFAGFRHPSPIQQKSIPLGKCGLDLVLQAKAGTGKTCVFAVLALDIVNTNRSDCQILVLSPTREIAVQSCEVIRALGQFMPNLSCQTCIGGIPISEDIKNMKKAHIVIGTAGRLKYVMECQYLNTNNIRLLVLDEADSLFSANSQPDINWIYSCLPKTKQVILLSATFEEELMTHVGRYMQSPHFIRLDSKQLALVGIRQYYCTVSSRGQTLSQIFLKKANIVFHILSSVEFHQCIIFSNYHSSAQNLTETLTKFGWPAIYMSSKLTQSERLDAYDKLKQFHCRVLVSTDLTSRGIDAKNVNLVINMEIPWEYETYLHRMGRAGRYGSYGAAISITDDDKELALLNKIRQHSNLSIQPLPQPLPPDLASDTFIDHSSASPDHLSQENSLSNLCPWEVTATSLNVNSDSLFTQQSNNHNQSTTIIADGQPLDSLNVDDEQNENVKLSTLISTTQTSLSDQYNGLRQRLVNILNQGQNVYADSDSLDHLQQQLANFRLESKENGSTKSFIMNVSQPWITTKDVDCLLAEPVKVSVSNQKLGAPENKETAELVEKISRPKMILRSRKSRRPHPSRTCLRLRQEYQKLCQTANEFYSLYQFCNERVEYYSAARSIPMPPLPPLACHFD